MEGSNPSLSAKKLFSFGASKIHREPHSWAKAWEDKSFSIETLQPSVLVSTYEHLLGQGAVLDVGCGNGRNSIYLASRGHNVHCFDVADLGWQNDLADEIKEKIDYKKSTILEYPYKISAYQAIIIARVIQYLDQEQLLFLMDRIKSSIHPDGFLLLSYTASGGIFDKQDIDVPKYSYSVEEIENVLKTIFNNVVVTEGSKTSKHVNYDNENLTFDIYASDPLEK